ncbi:MAG: chorismate--pyruvate lyase family protein [Halothiobacillaceae bacterium]
MLKAIDLPAWRLPAPLRPFLLERGSLTDRLAGCCPEKKIHVRVLFEGWQQTRLSESHQLGLPDRRVWVREVLLRCEDQDWVHARSLIPPQTFHALRRQLSELGTRPLGQLLFTWQGRRAGPILLYRDREGCPGRISRFVLRGQPMWVRERFLRIPGEHSC